MSALTAGLGLQARDGVRAGGEGGSTAPEASTEAKAHSQKPALPQSTPRASKRAAGSTGSMLSTASCHLPSLSHFSPLQLHEHVRSSPLYKRGRCKHREAVGSRFEPRVQVPSGRPPAEKPQPDSWTGPSRPDATDPQPCPTFPGLRASVPQSWFRKCPQAPNLTRCSPCSPQTEMSH